MKKFLVIIIITISIISYGSVVSADTYYMPIFPQAIEDIEYKYIYKDTNNIINLVVSNNPIGQRQDWSLPMVKGNYTHYHLIDNTYILVRSGSYSVYSSYPDAQVYSTSIWSNHDIYYSTYENPNLLSSVFFSKSKVPPYIIHNQQLLQPLHQSVTSNTQILLACGVGILSLILSVGLFRKLYLYL
ncbi:MAG: hypothetical protein QXI16_02190 [Sulfolobaceae archaeon]